MNHFKKFGIVAVFVGVLSPFVAIGEVPGFPDLFAPPPSPGDFNMTAPTSPGDFNMTAQPGNPPADQFNTTNGRPADQLTATNGTPAGGTSETIVFPNPSPYDTVMEILEAILRALVSILIPVITVMIVYSGYLFVTAGGNEKKLEDAKKMLLGVVIGAALILGAWVLAQAIASTISGLEP